MSQRTLGKASKIEMLTKIRAVTKIKSGKFFQDFDFGDGQNPENQYCQEPESYRVESNKIFLSRTKPDYFA